MIHSVNWKRILVLTLCVSPLLAQEKTPAPAPREAAAEQVVTEPEVLNRGPIHEAYAVPYSRDPVKTMLTVKEPPEAIDERPPARQPEGTTIRWIPGYWAFDEDRSDFVWVSGIWREVPQGRTWVPGYWTPSGNGFLWVPGNWTDAEIEEIKYLPEPPASKETGPTGQSPGEGYFWIPGNWEWADNDYKWRAGYWAPRQRDWIWVPARYTHSPLGYVYTSGYWDDLLSYRGVAFAPVYFREPPGKIVYSPAVALDAWQYLTLHLFVGPGHASYYFGDYYGSPFTERGYRPFFQLQEKAVEDPLFAYYRWRFGNDYDNSLIEWHKFFVENEALRPRRTFAEQLDFAAHHPNDNLVFTTSLVSNVQDIYHEDRTPLKFTDVTPEVQELTTNRLHRLHDLTTERVGVERVWRSGDERPGFPIRASKYLDRPWEDEAVRLKPRTPDFPYQMRDIVPDDRGGRTARVPARVSVRVRETPPERALPRDPLMPPAGAVAPPE